MFIRMNSFVVVISGTSGAGKSTVVASCAEALGATHAIASVSCRLVLRLPRLLRPILRDVLPGVTIHLWHVADKHASHSQDAELTVATAIVNAEGLVLRRLACRLQGYAMAQCPLATHPEQVRQLAAIPV